MDGAPVITASDARRAKMGTVGMHYVVPVDGFVAEEVDDVGPSRWEWC